MSTAQIAAQHALPGMAELPSSLTGPCTVPVSTSTRPSLHQVESSAGRSHNVGNDITSQADWVNFAVAPNVGLPELADAQAKPHRVGASRSRDPRKDSDVVGSFIQTGQIDRVGASPGIDRAANA